MPDIQAMIHEYPLPGDESTLEPQTGRATALCWVGAIKVTEHSDALDLDKHHRATLEQAKDELRALFHKSD